MKTLIVYGTTYGFTEQCVKTLAQKLGGQADLINIGKGEPATLAGYDAVVLGSSIYMGQINKKLKDYMDAHAVELAKKKVGLFLCSGLPENLEQNFNTNFPRQLLEVAVAKEHFGGVLNKSKMSFGHKMITKMMESVTQKEGKPAPAPKPEGIDRLAAAMNA